MDSQAHPLFLSPALPSDLLQFIIRRCSYPTTLIICADRAEFIASLTQDLQVVPQTQPPHPLLTSPLHTVAVARHIRTVFVPTVTHLRAFLSVLPFPDGPSKVSPPPPPPPPPRASAACADASASTRTTTTTTPAPLLLVYDFLGLHRDTSEWSVQGLSSSVAVLVDVARGAGMRAVVVERAARPSPFGQGEGAAGRMREVLGERVPVLSGSASWTGGSLERGGWTGRTVDVGRVLGRWFRVRLGEWDAEAGWASRQP